PHPRRHRRSLRPGDSRPRPAASGPDPTAGTCARCRAERTSSWVDLVGGQRRCQRDIMDARRSTSSTLVQSARGYNSLMRIILTGVTGMVGEGVLLECLENDSVEKVLSVSRRPTDHAHPKLEQLLVPDFRKTSDVEAKLTGYDACFYCAGVSSIGMS